jgi:histidine triad (HIT) family protein
MSNDATCLFCKIVAKAEPAVLVHEDERCIAFMDIYPLGAGHVLVIPKQHAQQLEEFDQALQHHLYAVCNRIVAAQRAAGLGVDGTHFLLNDGKAANQHIPHVHFHLIPRSGRDNLAFFYRMVLHLTGLFGFRASSRTLQQQADQIRPHLRQPLSAHEHDLRMA